MTLLRERTEIREVPKLQRPRRPWFGWIVSLVVLIVAGGIWLIVRGTDTGTDGSFEANELARFERIGAAAVEVAPTPDGFDRAELERFGRIGTEPASALPTFELEGDLLELAPVDQTRLQEFQAALEGGEVCFSCGTEGWGTG